VNKNPPIKSFNSFSEFIKICRNNIYSLFPLIGQIVHGDEMMNIEMPLKIPNRNSQTCSIPKRDQYFEPRKRKKIAHDRDVSSHLCSAVLDSVT
jgi:hypothetical protein